VVLEDERRPVANALAHGAVAVVQGERRVVAAEVVGQSGDAALLGVVDGDRDLFHDWQRRADSPDPLQGRAVIRARRIHARGRAAAPNHHHVVPVPEARKVNM
jgi:hypothetical protein